MCDQKDPAIWGRSHPMTPHFTICHPKTHVFVTQRPHIFVIFTQRPLIFEILESSHDETCDFTIFSVFWTKKYHFYGILLLLVCYWKTKLQYSLTEWPTFLWFVTERPHIFKRVTERPPVFSRERVTERPLCSKCAIALVRHFHIWVPPPRGLVKIHRITNSSCL